MNGGYIMIDCKGLDLTTGLTPQTINGIYNATKRAMPINKPMYAVNCIWGEGKPVTPIQCMVIDFGDCLICTASTLQIIITPDDTVTINNLVGDDSDEVGNDSDEVVTSESTESASSPSYP